MDEKMPATRPPILCVIDGNGKQLESEFKQLLGSPQDGFSPRFLELLKLFLREPPSLTVVASAGDTREPEE